MRPKGFAPRRPGRHRILLVDPASEVDLYALSDRRTTYPPVTSYLAALVPADWDVMILDCVFDELDYDMDVAVVGITTVAHRYNSFCEIAAGFRRKGVCVMLGGPEVSRAPESYETICDSLLVGEAEGFVPKMLEDWENGRLQKRYINSVAGDLKSRALPRHDLLPPRRYWNHHLIMISTSCPYHCSFCNYNRTRAPRLRPVKDVAAEIKAPQSRQFWFAAPELLVYKDYVAELEREIGPLKVTCASHATMRSCLDDRVLRSAYRAGLRQIHIGIESFSQASLDFVNKGFNRVDTYQRAFKLLDEARITICCNIIVGLPKDTVLDYERTLQGLVKGKTSAVEFHVMGVYSGDTLFETSLLAAGGRPLGIFSANKELFKSCYKYYKPPQFDDKLFFETYARFESYYSFPNIARRLFSRSAVNISGLWPNLVWNVVLRLSHVNPTGRPWDLYRHVDEQLGLPPGTTRQSTLSPPNEARSLRTDATSHLN